MDHPRVLHLMQAPQGIAAVLGRHEPMHGLGLLACLAMASPREAQRPSRERAIDVLLWGLTGASAALTLLLSLGPVPPGADTFSSADKAFHGLAYFVTTLLFLFAAVWRPVRGSGSLARFAPVLIIAIVLSGLVVEILQGMLTTEREAELGDWGADASGVLVAVVVHGLVRRLAGVPHVSTSPDASARP